MLGRGWRKQHHGCLGGHSDKKQIQRDNPSSSSSWASLIAQLVKNPPVMQEIPV